MNRLIRELLGIEARVTRDEAIGVAKAKAESRDWPWTEPVAVTEGLAEYRIFTNSGRRGGNVIIRVDVRTGEISHATYAER